MASVGFFSQNYMPSASEWRRLLGSLYSNTNSASVLETGLIFQDYTDGLVRSQPSPNMSVNVQGFNGVIRETDRSCYVVSIDSQSSVAIPPSNSLNPRIDRIAVRVFEDGDTTRTSGTSIMQTYTLAAPYTGTVSRQNASVEVVCWAGDPAPTPVAKPFGTGMYIELARVYVRAAATQINSAGTGSQGFVQTDMRKFVGVSPAAGGVCMVPTLEDARTLLPKGAIYRIGTSAIDSMGYMLDRLHPHPMPGSTLDWSSSNTDNRNISLTLGNLTTFEECTITLHADTYVTLQGHLDIDPWDSGSQCSMRIYEGGTLIARADGGRTGITDDGRFGLDCTSLPQLAAEGTHTYTLQACRMAGNGSSWDKVRSQNGLTPMLKVTAV